MPLPTNNPYILDAVLSILPVTFANVQGFCFMRCNKKAPEIRRLYIMDAFIHFGN